MLLAAEVAQLGHHTLHPLGTEAKSDSPSAEEHSDDLPVPPDIPSASTEEGPSASIVVEHSGVPPEPFSIPSMVSPSEVGAKQAHSFTS